MRLIDADKLIDNGIKKGFCDWYDEIKYAQTVQAIPLDKIKEAREKIAKVYPESIFDHDKALRTTLQIIDELIAESEG